MQQVVILQNQPERKLIIDYEKVSITLKLLLRNIII